MILEGIVTSQDTAGRINVAPMGPIVDESMETLLLRPFQTSTTYQNLKRHPFGVFHVVDDVLLLAQSAIGHLAAPPETFAALTIPARVLKSTCRWYEFRITELNDSEERTRIEARIVHAGRLRDVFGFNRAKHAVLEAAILATRVHILPADQIRSQFEALRSPVEKTSGPREDAAFSLLENYITDRLQDSPAS